VTLDLILIALVIALEPIPLTTFILVLASRGGVRKGAGFLFGWLLSLAVVIAATVLVTGNQPPQPNSAPSLAALALKMAIGVALVLIAMRHWRRMGNPKWQTGIDTMSPWFAIGLGPLTQPWGLVAAGVAVIVDAKISSWQSYLALFLFCVISTSTYLAMEIYAGFRPGQTQAFLTRTRTWIDTHTDQVIVVVSLGLGFWLIGRSIYQIVS
jgi:hypothetical protein